MSEPEREPTEGATGRAVWLSALTVAVAFVAGIGVGTLVSDRPAAGPPPGPPSPALFEALELTADQQAVVDSVLAATRTATAASLEDTRRELTTQAVEALRAIEAVLDPDQIETLKTRIEARQTGRDTNPDPPGTR